MVAPVLHVLPVAELDVKVTDPPLHKVVGPLAVIVGVDKTELTFIVTVFEYADPQVASIVTLL